MSIEMEVKHDGSSHVYYDCIMRNNSDTQFQQAQFSETRQIPLLKKQDDYYMAVTSFTCPTHNMPIFVAEPSHNPLDSVYKLAYSVTMSDGLNTFTIPLEIGNGRVPNGIPIPTTWDPNNRINFWQFYSIYSYNQFM